QLAFVKSVLHLFSFVQGRKTAQPNELVGILQIKQRPHDLHAVCAQGRDRSRFEKLDELGAAAGLDSIASHFNNHDVSPRSLSNREGVITLSRACLPRSNSLPRSC